MGLLMLFGLDSRDQSSLKKALALILLFLYAAVLQAQERGGTVVFQTFRASSIEHNRGGEVPDRSVSVYLPPGYDKGTDRYPVVYFLHGYGVTDSLMFEWLNLKDIMDRAIETGRIRPMLLVLPNSKTRYLGSFYTNSDLTGNWADFIGKDVVAYVDQKYRTIPDRESRGLCGHSMGGHGALKLAMQYSDVFSSVYSLSAGALHWSQEFNLNSRAFKILQNAKTEKDVITEIDEPGSPDDPAFWVPLFASLGRTFSPDESNLPVKAQFPVRYDGDVMTVNNDVLSKWEKNFPVNMIPGHLRELKSLKAIKLDWGRNDEFPHIPKTNLEFSKRLEAFRINHYAEEYIGNHVNKLGGFDGRIYTELLPFFDTYLRFETPAPRETSRRKGR